MDRVDDIPETKEYLDWLCRGISVSTSEATAVDSWTHRPRSQYPSLQIAEVQESVHFSVCYLLDLIGRQSRLDRLHTVYCDEGGTIEVSARHVPCSKIRTVTIPACTVRRMPHKSDHAILARIVQLLDCWCADLSFNFSVIV